VLSRFQPFVPYHPLVNMTGWEATNETANFAVAAKNDALFEPFVQDPLRLAGLGRVSLKALDVAILTVDLRSLLRNMTYNAHYQLSVYIDCEPCKVRYDCAWYEAGAVRPPCCDCQRHGLPFFFEEGKKVDPASYRDDKNTRCCRSTSRRSGTYARARAAARPLLRGIPRPLACAGRHHRPPPVARAR
jgi:hypothetical protein